MKYGQTFQAQSVPQWAPYNIDYNELKNIIKVNTTKDQAQAIVIPGQADTALSKFEDSFFNELANQYDRVDLFVKDKVGEISRRLESNSRAVVRLLAKRTYNNGKPMSQKRRETFAKRDDVLVRIGEDIKSLHKFVEAQRVAFHKILKKYKKWTGSRSLGDRFNNEVLADPKSFTRRDFESLHTQYNDILTNLRAYSPDPSEPATPSKRSRRPSTQISVQQAPQAYWNEYDNGSEFEDEPYTIYIDPNADSTYPGAKAFASLYSRAKVSMDKVKAWLSPTSLPGERRPLRSQANRNGGYLTEQTETDVDDEAYASSSDFPSGYATHYATFPSLNDQKFSMFRERFLFRATIISFIASLVLMVTAGTLVATGRHRLRIEVDAGVIVGVVGSLFFGTLGFGTMVYRAERISWFHRLSVIFTFCVVCVVNGSLLVLVVGNTGL